jgi:hypothetical protein
VLEPNGTFYVEAMKPTPEETHISALKDAVDALTHEVRTMRAQLAGG